MLVDSFYENRAPVPANLGTSRLNNRLAFFAYEVRRLQTIRAASSSSAQVRFRTDPRNLICPLVKEQAVYCYKLRR